MSFYYDDSNNLRAGRIAGSVVGGFVALMLLVTTLAMWPFAKVPQSHVALSYGGGLIEGQHFQGIKQPGSGLFVNGWGDHLYEYPTTQRNYIISQRAGEGDLGGKDSVRAVTSDNVQVEFELAVYFKLNTNDNKLREFHENIGLKYKAWSEKGWDRMLNDSFRQQIENSLQEETRAVSINDLYSNQAALLRIQGEVGSVLRERVADSLGGNYFCGPTFVRGQQRCPEFQFIIKRLTVPNKVKEAFENNRTSQIEVQTKQNEIAQRTAEAEAIRQLNAALAQAGDNYVELKRIEMMLEAIKSGKISFWVLPDGTGVNVPAPTAGK